MKERDALAPTEELPEDAQLYTTQPSIFMDTTPESYPDGWTECLVSPDAKAFILSQPEFPAPLLRPSALQYRLSPTPDKGLGLFCTAKIRANDLILSERPLTLTPTSSSTRMRFLKELDAREQYLAATHEWEKSLKFLFDRLYPDYQAAFMGLANSHKHDGSGLVGGIIRTNGLGVILPPNKYSLEEQQTRRKGVYSAVCKEISRVNHSCSPNTTAHFDVITFSFQLFAVRDIAQGEELTLTYTDLKAPAEMRQSDLEPYGFHCTCSACATSCTSDALRERSMTMQIDNIDDGLLKLALLEEQGLESSGQYCKTLETVMELYIGIGDADNASTCAKKLVNRRWSSLASGAKLYTSPLAIEKFHPLWKGGGNRDLERGADNLECSFGGLELGQAE
ncbi:SET domain-containing protein [Mycena sanguinolenta]|uniref:SET domain-containing protein n=1 Tax=Mycena sanguinolenta TaxID=230812 RepID=A0A8H6Y254_9AGAR|nr:SET domain-containing protein [Mycena sanguinolenta]